MHLQSVTPWKRYPPKFGGSKTTNKFSVRFLMTTLRLDREYLQNATRYCQSENAVANGDHSCACTLNWVNFGPELVKNRQQYFYSIKFENWPKFIVIWLVLSEFVRGIAPIFSL